MKTEEKYIGKYFKLIPGHSYFIPELQEYVKFVNYDLAVKITNLFYGKPAFGKLVRIGAGPFCSDFETNIDIELNEDALGEEYQINLSGILFYTDFSSMFEKDKPKII